MVTLVERTVVRAPIERCFDLARSVEVHLAGNVHFGEMAMATGGVTSGLLNLGDRVTWRARHFGIRWQLTSEIAAMDWPNSFQHVMLQGPFRSMKHDHVFRGLSENETEMRDVFCFEAPLPVLGHIAEITFLRRYMRALLRERNAVLKRIAESEGWPAYLPG